MLMFALFCAWVMYESRRTVRLKEKREEAFWEREQRANLTRRKPIDHLEYITIPEDLPINLHTDNDDICACIRTIDGLRDEKILNLTGWSNTDLKLEYGAPNITELSRYDQNYTTLVTTLQKWADLLIGFDKKEEAYKILEFMVSTKCDIKKTYTILADHYSETGHPEKIKDLIKIVEDTKSLNTGFIKAALEEQLNKGTK